MTCFSNIPTQVCVVLKSFLSKAIARYRAKVMLQDAIGLRSHKRESEAVRKFSFDVA